MTTDKPLSNDQQISHRHVPTVYKRLTNIYPESTKSLPGLYQDSTRILPGLCQESTRSLPGIYQESTRNLPQHPYHMLARYTSDRSCVTEKTLRRMTCAGLALAKSLAFCSRRSRNNPSPAPFACSPQLSKLHVVTQTCRRLVRRGGGAQPLSARTPSRNDDVRISGLDGQRLTVQHPAETTLYTSAQSRLRLHRNSGIPVPSRHPIRIAQSSAGRPEGYSGGKSRFHFSSGLQDQDWRESPFPIHDLRHRLRSAPHTSSGGAERLAGLRGRDADRQNPVQIRVLH